jgi:hypothetical protein
MSRLRRKSIAMERGEGFKLMSFGFSSSKSKQKTQEKSQSDPWDVATPYITEFLGKDISPLIGTSMTQPNAAQSEAFGKLRATAQDGNPYTQQTDQLTRDLFGSQSRAPAVDAAYADYSRRLTPTADGTNRDLMSNPYMAEMLSKVSGDARTRANETFAGAGRSFSGAHAGALGTAVTEAQLPMLFDQYNREQGRTDTAATNLFQGAQSASTTGQNLDQASATLRSMGIDVGNAALDAKNWGPNQILAIEQTLKDMPVEQAAKLAAILFPAGQLGQQSEGSGTTKGKTSGFKIGGSLLGGG